MNFAMRENIEPMKHTQSAVYTGSSIIGLKYNKGIIIACDTFVIKGLEIYGKPKDRNDAYNILKSLSGVTHEVLSCLTVIKIKDNIEDIYQTQSSCKVTIDSLSDKEIYEWIDNNKPYDKAGAYAIQEEFGKYMFRLSEEARP